MDFDWDNLNCEQYSPFHRKYRSLICKLEHSEDTVNWSDFHDKFPSWECDQQRTERYLFCTQEGVTDNLMDFLKVSSLVHLFSEGLC